MTDWSDRQAANFAMEKAIECLAFADRHNERLKALEAIVAQQADIIDEMLVLMSLHFRELQSA